MEKKENLTKEEAKKVLDQQYHMVWSDLLMMTANMYTMGYKPQQIMEYLNNLSTGAYDWLKGNVEKSGYSMSECSMAYAADDEKKYRATVKAFDNILKGDEDL